MSTYGEKNVIAINQSKNGCIADEANITQDASIFLKPPAFPASAPRSPYLT